MAASVVSLSAPAIESASSTSMYQSQSVQDKDPDEDLKWVLPSEVDCLGRPLRSAPLTVLLWQKVSLSSLRSYIGRLRQPVDDELMPW